MEKTMTNSAEFLKMTVVDSPDGAPCYEVEHPDTKGATIHSVIVIGQATDQGKAAVQFQIRGNDGNEYMALLTAKMLRAIIEQANQLEDRP